MLPEPPRVNPVQLYFEVKRLVIGSQQPRRLALVPFRALENAADRTLLRVGRSRFCKVALREMRIAPISRRDRA